MWRKIIFISILLSFTTTFTSFTFASDVVTVHKYKDGWGKSHSCVYHKHNTKRKGNIYEVQLDRIHPEKVVREWIRMNCNTKKYSIGKIKHLDTGYTADFGYYYWYSYDIAKADLCTGRLIDLVCK